MLLYFLPLAWLQGQETTEQLIEDVAAQQAAGGEFAFNDVFFRLEGYRRRPLDLNAATAEELDGTLLLSPAQTQRLLAHRDRLGGFMSVYELQAVPGLDLETVRRLLPFVRAGAGLDDVTVPLTKMLVDADRELFVRTSRRLETARGYRPPDARYRGGPWRGYLKYRQRYGNLLSLGLVAEKDPGEPLLRGVNRRRGFDYYSAHLFVRNINRRLRALAIGDFSVSFGQGLILYTGFGFGKSSLTTTVARGAPTLQPYASVNEASFMRGAGATLALGDFELTVFGSRRGRSGNLSKDSLSVSSLRVSGYHRTAAELEDRKVVTQHSYGGSLKYRPHRRLRLALNFLGEHLSLPLLRRPAAYNRYYFSGDRLHNLSIDYRYRLHSVTFFGEVAGASGAGTAMLHGMNVGVSPRADLALVYRRYERDYHALNARPFGETSGGRNEEGVYAGVELRPAKRWRVNAYYDLWRHAYLRYNVDGPSSGREYRLRLTYSIKRRLDAYAEWRHEAKGVGGDGGPDATVDPVVTRRRAQLRLHAGYKITPVLEWRSRLDLGYSTHPTRGWQDGAMFFQGLHYRPLGPLSLSGRVAVFSTDGYAVRFYEYENGLTYNAFVIPYYNRGARAFLLLRYKGIRDLTLEARLARTQYLDGNTFGSGWEATGKRYRTEVGGQVIWRW